MKTVWAGFLLALSVSPSLQASCASEIVRDPIVTPTCIEKKSGQKIPLKLFQSLPTRVYEATVRLDGDPAITKYILQVGVDPNTNLITVARVNAMGSDGFSIYNLASEAPKGTSELVVVYDTENPLLKMIGNPRMGIRYEFSFSIQGSENEPNRVEIIKEGSPANLPALPYKNGLFAVPFVVEFGSGSIQHLPLEEKRRYADRALNGLSTIKNFALSDNNPFDWKDNQEALKDKKLHIILTRSDDPTAKRLLLGDDLIRPIDAETRGFTYYFVNEETGTKYILLFLLVDRIFTNEKGTAYLDSQAKLLGTLGHEVFGNVHHFLEKNYPPGERRESERGTREIGAFNAGIDFLERFMDNEAFTQLADMEREYFNRELATHKKMLNGWIAKEVGSQP